jgi:hypothetical protein
MAELTLEQKWELLRTWAQTLVNHAKSKDQHHLKQDVDEIVNAVKMIEADPQAHSK